MNSKNKAKRQPEQNNLQNSGNSDNSGNSAKIYATLQKISTSSKTNPAPTHSPRKGFA
jgi:hypothetical protein